MKKYVDKLDFLSKWVLIPKLITGKDFPTDSQAYELLVKLKKARNDLVHFKTRTLSGKNSLTEGLRMLDDDMEVEECFNCMSESLSVLKGLDSQKWPLFSWIFIERLMSKSFKDIKELAIERIRSALGFEIQTDDNE